ncbi:X8 domain [Musa troglodytarum]|uniref:X8 domain n=1 Tax=Musa troglodytarum TaxID=320322 RepID=A0A9E7EHH2_9LILI|nr:X8 domain [Musa troglodytarum]
MATFLLLVLAVAMFSGSDAAWCVCRSDMSNNALQKTLDYACGTGADCTPVLQNGACYNPNTVLAHCSYAANSYYQRKGQAQGACDFAGTAALTSTDPGKPSPLSPRIPRRVPLTLPLSHSYCHPLWFCRGERLHIPCNSQCCRNFRHSNKHHSDEQHPSGRHSDKHKHHSPEHDDSYYLQPSNHGHHPHGDRRGAGRTGAVWCKQ